MWKDLQRYYRTVTKGLCQILICQPTSWTYSLFQKTISKVGALISFAKKDWINTHLCLSVSYHAIFAFKVVFYFAENPVECFSLSESITNLNDPFEGSVGTEYRSNEKYATIHTQIVLVQYQLAQIFRQCMSNKKNVQIIFEKLIIKAFS